MLSDYQFGDQPAHERWMRAALSEARQAVEEDEVPVGAVVVAAGRIVGSAHNQREQLADPTAHAEMIALTQAASSLGSWRLVNCVLYVKDREGKFLFATPQHDSATAIELYILARRIATRVDEKILIAWRKNKTAT